MRTLIPQVLRRLLLLQNHPASHPDLARWFHGRNDQPEVSTRLPSTEHPPTSSRATRDCLPESGRNLQRFSRTRFVLPFLSFGLLATFLPEPCYLLKARSFRRWSLRYSYLHYSRPWQSSN